MKVTKTEHYIELSGLDENGEFKIRVQKDCSQLQMETKNNDAFIDINYHELKAIHNAIAEVLGSFGRDDV